MMRRDFKKTGLVVQLLIEFAKVRQTGRSLTDLISALEEPEESQEFRIKIQTEDFKTHGLGVIDQLQTFVEQQPN